MINRTRTLFLAGFLVGGILLMLVLSFAYPFTLDERAEVPGQQAEPALIDSHEIEEEIVVHQRDGVLNSELHRQLVVDGDDVVERNRHDTTEDGEVVTIQRTERYSDTDAEWTTARWELKEAEGAERVEMWVEDDEEEEIVDQYIEDQKHVLVVAGEESGNVDERTSDFYHSDAGLWNRHHPNYEQHGEATFEGRDVVVYEPQDGWYPSFGTLPEYRVIDSEGELYVDAETGTLLYADLSYTVVEASNYAEYFLEQWEEEDVLEIEIRYEFSDDGEVEQPEWADEPD